MGHHTPTAEPDLEAVLQADQWARREAGILRSKS